LFQQFELCQKSLNEVSEEKHDLPEKLIWAYLVDLLLVIHLTILCCPQKMPPWANFINVLQAAFALKDPKSGKKTNSLTEFLRFRDLHL